MYSVVSTNEKQTKTCFFLLLASHFSLTSYALELMAWLTTNLFIVFTLYTVYTFLNEMWPTYWVSHLIHLSELCLLWQIVQFGTVSRVCSGRKNFGGKSSPAFTSGKTQTAYGSISRVWSQHVIWVKFHYQYSHRRLFLCKKLLWDQIKSFNIDITSLNITISLR